MPVERIDGTWHATPCTCTGTQCTYINAVEGTSAEKQGILCPCLLARQGTVTSQICTYDCHHEWQWHFNDVCMMCGRIKQERCIFE